MSLQPYDLIKPFVRQKLEDTVWHACYEEFAEYKKHRHNDSKAIRLDWEVKVSPIETINIGKAFKANKDLIVSLMCNDISDILVNGDVESTDPLLKTLNGEIKLGIRFKDIHISDAVWYGEYKFKKDTIEFTVYTTIKGILV